MRRLGRAGRHPDKPSAAQAFGFEFDSCAAWDAAATAIGLTPDEEQRIWLSIDDNQLDTLFVDLSECGYEENGVEDPVADDSADAALFLEYLTTVADGALAAGYSDQVYDLGSGTDAERDEYERQSADATEQILNVAREAASQLWWRADDTTLAGKLYIAANISIDDWTELSDRELDWDDIGNRVCDGWTMVLEEYAGEELDSIASSVNDLGLEGTLIPERCG